MIGGIAETQDVVGCCAARNIKAEKLQNTNSLLITQHRKLGTL